MGSKRGTRGRKLSTYRAKTSNRQKLRHTLRMNARTESIPVCGTQSNAGACTKQVFFSLIRLHTSAGQPFPHLTAGKGEHSASRGEAARMSDRISSKDAQIP